MFTSVMSVVYVCRLLFFFLAVLVFYMVIFCLFLFFVFILEVNMTCSCFKEFHPHMKCILNK